MLTAMDGPGRSWRPPWFAIAIAVVAAANLALATFDDWSEPALVEAGVLFDLALVIPGLYWWGHRSRGRPVLVRAIALGCLGIWIAGHLVPDEHHRALGTVGVLRYIGLAVLVVIELRLVAMFVRAIFGQDADPQPAVLTAARDADLPPWIARLLAWEASMWRRAWNAVRRMLGRR